MQARLPQVQPLPMPWGQQPLPSPVPRPPPVLPHPSQAPWHPPPALPQGPSLPPPQIQLEQDYKRLLAENFGVRFNQLLTITNQPIARFGSTLAPEPRIVGAAM